MREASVTPDRTRMRPVRYMLGFALGGPLVGYALLGLLSAGLNGLAGVLILSLFGFPIAVAYAVGVAPAAITGLAAGWSLSWGRAWLFVLTAVLVGAVSTMALNLVSSYREGLADYGRNAVLGGGSALVCALVALTRNRMDLRLPNFAPRWHAGNVVLAILVAVMIVMVATLLVPALGPALAR